MSGSVGAEQAAELIGQQIGVSPSVIYGQFVAEDGSSLNPSGAYNYGNLQPGGTEASYSSLGAFVSAFVSTIKNNFSGAENTGSNAAAYAAGLFPSNGPAYETGVSQQQYTQNIEAGAAMSGSSGAVTTSTGMTNPGPQTVTSSNGIGDTFSNFLNQITGGAVLTNSQAATAQSQIAAGAAAGYDPVTDPVAAAEAGLNNFLGLNISAYDVGLVIVGVILVLGAVLFISKPAVQSVTVSAAKVAGIA
jgi:hypothetical protein